MAARPLHPVLIYGLPILILVFQAATEILVPVAMKPAFFSEQGPLEYIESAFLAAALFLSMRLFIKSGGNWMKAWAALAALGCFYTLGEEISWGQHFFEWTTPEFWARVNDQNETNLHNTSSWLDQKPRLLLEAGVMAGGLLVPLMQKYFPVRSLQRFASIFPDGQTVFTALLAIFVKIADTAQDMGGAKIFWRGSEVLELYLYYFVALYLMALIRRQRAVSEA